VTPVVQATDVVRVHATRNGRAAALQGLTLDVAEGEILVVFGPSGSGKTSLLRILAALDAPSAGRVRVRGTDLRLLRGRRRELFRAANIGYADQHYSRLLAPELRARDVVEVPLALRGEAPRARAARADELLERVGLADRADAFPSELSGGEQQRVALCAAVAGHPPLLLADEPTGELDARNAGIVYELIGELVRSHGGSAVIVSHDPGAAEIADRIVQIRDGRISAETLPGGDESLVVSEGGWLRVPEELRARVQLGPRARPDATDGAVRLSPAVEASPAAPSAEPAAERKRPASSGSVAEVRAVERRFTRADAPVLQRLTTSFPAGRLTAISGPSGSGKTTLLHLLAGLDLPTNGEVIVLGEQLSGLDRAARAEFRRRNLALVAQDPPLVPFLTARENVELGLRLRGASDGPALDALAAVGVRALADERLSRLSMGERQRVAIARAIAAEPALLLADEPTARLDQANAAAFGELLTQLVDERGLTVVFSTHDAVLLTIADDVVRLA
jgi:ABC-type lipoprotein export system ATPase subunit